MDQILFLHSLFIISILFLWFIKSKDLYGKPIWYDEKKIWTIESSGKTTSQLVFDPYSFTHISHGILFYILLQYFFPKQKRIYRVYTALIIEIIWEIFENTEFVIKQFRKTEKSSFLEIFATL